MKKIKNHFRTWIELDKKALEHNVRQFLKLIPKRTRLMAVVKSNAYGHGLVQTAEFLANQTRINSRIFANKNSRLISDKLWFGVDSIVEALRLREEGIKNPILVLGSTLPNRMKEAAEKNIILTISNFESLSSLIRVYPVRSRVSNGAGKRIAFHLKIDTGMHRQGFLFSDVPKLIKFLKHFRLSPHGVYTHFASKDWGYPIYTQKQFSEFKKILSLFQRGGFGNLIRHAAASDTTLLFPETHLDMVRVGMVLYGYWSSWVAKVKHPPQMVLKPILTWKTIVVEVKEIPAGSYVGYDLTERVSQKTKIAVLPVGYWHGIDRGLSSIGEVLIRGRRRKVLGRVSMDMVVVDVTDKPHVKVGNEAVLLGKQGKDAIWADEIALKIGTSAYEVLTRINPLIERN